MSPEIMGPEPNPDFVPRLLDHCPGCFVRYGENPLVHLNSIFPDIFFEPVSHLLRDENMLPFFAAFGVSKGQFPVMDVNRPQLQDLTHSHAATGHEFQHETVSEFLGCEDDFIDHVLLDDLPGNHGPRSEHLPHHWVVAGIVEIGIDIRSDEVEEG